MAIRCMFGLVLSALLAQLEAASVPVKRYNTSLLAPEDYETLNNLPRLPTYRKFEPIYGFHYLFVWNDGHITTTHGYPGQTIEIAGSPRSSMADLRVAAETVAKMVKYMPNDIFWRISDAGSVGIFTKEETLVIFPEFFHLANGNCGSSCYGRCSITCTFDGRKWADVAGAGGVRAAVLDQNVVCGPRDPHHGNLNVLIHEFGHLIHRHGYDTAQTGKATRAYNNAKAKHLWTTSSYAMETDGEYMATSISVFVGANDDDQDNTGGMNLCGHHICPTEQASRAHLNNVDPQLYTLLMETLVSNKPNAWTNLKTCPV